MAVSRETMAALAAAGEAVLGIAVAAGLGAWSGMWLDDRLHTTPWLAICLALLGMSLGLARMVIKAIEADRAGESSSGSHKFPAGLPDESDSEDD